MTELLGWLPSLTFGLLGVAAIARWVRERRPGQIYLAVAMALLGVAAIANSLPSRVLPDQVTTAIEVFGFAASGFALLLFRNTVVPVPRRILAAAGAGLGVLTVIGVLAGIPDTFQALSVAWGLVAIGWVACVAEPIARFWAVSRHLPWVQRRRVRWLSAGYVSLLALIAVGFIPVLVPGLENRVYAVIDVASIGAAALLYGSFAPPAWMRREWRRREEADLRSALTDLLQAADRRDLAGLALAWALRLVGAEAGVIVDGGGTVLAAQPADWESNPELRAAVAKPPRAHSPRHHRGALAAVQLPSAELGEGMLAVSAGRFTPFMGDEETERLSDYAAAVAVGLDRAWLTEQLKETNDELRRANDLKSQFVANMSHELRTPLNSIIGFSELLMEGTAEDLPEGERADYVRRIHSSGTHLLSLINNMLDLSKIEAGRMTIELGLVEPDLLVAEVVASMEAAATAKHVRISVDTPRLPALLADEMKVKRVLLNLLSNAVRFSPAGGRVAVQAASSATAVCFSVADEGPGIDAADLPHIFERYSPLGGSAADSTGLGLSLAKQLVDMHSGRIWVESEPGHGSRFQFELPLKAA